MAVSTLIVMGVSGCGKSTIASRLAQLLNWEFVEGDEFHPPSNIQKMANAIPLTDDDRWPWLDHIAGYLQKRLEENKPVILACSALKEKYRERLSAHLKPRPLFIYLKGSQERIAKQLSQRKGHYMPLSLLQSQFEALEEPAAKSNAIIIEIDEHPDRMIERILAMLKPHLTTS